MNGSARKGAGYVLVVLVVMVIPLVIAAMIGYGIGVDEDAVACEAGPVVAVDVTDADELGNGRRVVEVGDCERLDDATMVAIVEALVSGSGGAATTTTSAKAPATTQPPSK